MRSVTFGCATSLDGFIARADHSTDWLRWNDEVAALSNALWSTVDAVVMGRKTYEVAVRAGTTAYPGVANYVCSRTLARAPDPAVVVVSEEAVDFVDRLKRSAGRGICVMGGGELGTALLAAGLVDRVGLNVHPILLGSGIPLFHPISESVQLRLEQTTPLPGGCVYLLYRVGGPTEA
ncbi:MAG: dihydrofolate reductase family protein [Gemmatimonadales bacterium]